ncbi:MAG: hypothetical protein LIP08_06875 [Bacteroides sp.]|nr:hypothetical protein [Bacteroides sp.]
MNRQHFISYLSVCLLWSATALRAQDIMKNIRPETPAIAQFTRYDEMPVSEYTGIPDISIPLYTIEEDGFQLPLQLTYHAGGIKVNQEASWVGLGWDLPLSSVVQIINDECDFGTAAMGSRKINRMLPDYPATTTGVGCITEFPMRYRYPGSIDGIGWTATYPTYTPQIQHAFKVATDCYVPYKKDFTTKREIFFSDNGGELCDSEPDIFKVQLFGETVHFIINWNTGAFVPLNRQGYKISRSGDSWTVTNPHGEKFLFTQKIETISDITSGSPSGSYFTTRKSMVAWLLTQITTRHGKVIHLEYEVSSPYTRPAQVSEVYTSPHSRTLSTLTSNVAAYGQPPYKQIHRTSVTSREPYFYLKKITFPKGSAEFTLASRTDVTQKKRLSKITIYDHMGNYRKQIELKNDYFNPNNTKKRLKLTGIMINFQRCYSFYYNETLSLPELTSLSQDCWGYYNGHANTTLIPNPARYYLPNWKDVTNNKNNLSSNLPYTQAGILKEIVYPTGGSVGFEYESHTFDNYTYRVPDYSELRSTTNSGITKGHGLRVRSVVHKNSDGKVLKQTEYTYEGGKAILPRLFFRTYSYKDLGYTPTIQVSTRIGSSIVEESTLSGYTVFNPLSSMDGVGYSKVTKRIKSTDGKDNGRIETSYHNHPDITFLNCSQNDAIAPIPAYKNHSKPANGSVEGRKYYDRQGNLVREESHSYKNILSSLFYGARISNYNYYFALVDPQINRYARHLLAYYPIFDFQTLVTRQEEITYLNGTPVKLAKEYTYDVTNRLSSTKETVSGTTATETTQYTYPGSTLAEEKQLVTLNRIAEPVVIQKLNYQGRVTDYLKNLYTLNGSRVNYSGYEKRRNSATPVIDQVKYEAFDSYDNPVQIRGKENLPVTYLWGYQGKYPIAEIINATYAEVKSRLGVALLQRLETTTEPAEADLNTLNNLRTSWPSVQVTTYLHQPLLG